MLSKGWKYDLANQQIDCSAEDPTWSPSLKLVSLQLPVIADPLITIAVALFWHLWAPAYTFSDPPTQTHRQTFKHTHMHMDTNNMLLSNNELE